MSNVLVFDLDGTLVVSPDFYRTIYSGTLEETVRAARGDAGTQMLKHCRAQYRGKGELALVALNIPFRAWAERLNAAPLDLLTPWPGLVEAMRDCGQKKVVYTGSPRVLALRMLDRLGFNQDDFDAVIGWEEPESFPAKWATSPLPFEAILCRFGCPAEQAWSVGDNWNADLAPAQHLGIRTAAISTREGSPDRRFSDVLDFLDFVERSH